MGGGEMSKPQKRSGKPEVDCRCILLPPHGGNATAIYSSRKRSAYSFRIIKKNGLFVKGKVCKTLESFCRLEIEICNILAK
jgi:hypothetical protein